MGKKALIFSLVGLVGLVFVSTVYCSLSVAKYPNFPFTKLMSSDNSGMNVVGVGPTPSAAFEDGVRQVRQLFGKFFISSESVVREGILEKDVIIEKGSFSGSKLDRFYEGLFRHKNEYLAVFRFPQNFMKTVRIRESERDKRFSKFTASFDVISYSSVSNDSFGEKVRKKWAINVPSFVKRFFDFFIWHTEDIGRIEIVTENG